MQRMSFSMTRQQCRERTKTETRRLGWKHLDEGDVLMAVSKVMGIRPGEEVEVFGAIRVRHVHRERLDAITPEQVTAEGFPELTVDEFVQMFCTHMGCNPATIVTRIVFAWEPEP